MIRHVTMETSNIEQSNRGRKCFGPSLLACRKFLSMQSHNCDSAVSHQSFPVEEFLRGMEAKLKENGWWVFFCDTVLFYFMRFMFVVFKSQLDAVYFCPARLISYAHFSDKFQKLRFFASCM